MLQKEMLLFVASSGAESSKERLLSGEERLLLDPSINSKSKRESMYV